MKKKAKKFITKMIKKYFSYLPNCPSVKINIACGDKVDTGGKDEDIEKACLHCWVKYFIMKLEDKNG